MKERASTSVEGLVQDLERLREQGRAVGEVLRAVTRGEGLQPVFDELSLLLRGFVTVSTHSCI
jgi:hypothetical protein